MERQTRAAAAAAAATTDHQTAREVRVAKALSVSAIPEHQLVLLLVQQTRQHNLAVSPSIISWKMEIW
jgi:hypothetical protein